MSDDPRILLIDDDAADRALAAALLRDDMPQVRIREVRGALDFAELLGYRTWSVAIAEQTLSWANGVELLTAIKQRHPRCLTVLFTAAPADAIDVLGEALGVDAYVRKDSSGYLRLPGLLERALARNERETLGVVGRNLRGGLDAVPVGYFWCRSDGGFLDANIAFAQLLGLIGPDELSERSLLEFLADADARERCAQSLARGGRERFWPVRLGLTDGGALPVTLSFWPVPDGHGRECLEGIAWESESQAATEETHRPTALEAPAAPVAESAAPADPARAVVTLLRPGERRAPGDAKAESSPAMGPIPPASEAPAAATGETKSAEDASLELDLSEEVEAVPLKEAVIAAMDRLRPAIRESGARIRAAPLPVLQANRSELIRLFRELLDNAIKFRGAEPPRVSVRAEEHVEGWLLSVRDNGIGIPADRRRSLFAEGNQPGAGLAICRQIAEHYGGDVWVTSEPGNGATFFVALKARASETETVSLSVQYNGETMGRIAVRNVRNKREIARAALSIPRLQGRIGDRTITHVQFIRDDVVNIVA